MEKKHEETKDNIIENILPISEEVQNNKIPQSSEQNISPSSIQPVAVEVKPVNDTKEPIDQSLAHRTQQKSFQSPQIDYDKYDRQVQQLKSLGYAEQQIIDNLFRLNPELNDYKYVTAEVVGKYFPRKERIPLQIDSTLSGGMELTEEVKEFIESVLRRQLDAFRNIIEHERDRKPSFNEALANKVFTWCPLLIVLQAIFSFSFLISRGGIDCLSCIFYGPPVASQIIAYSLISIIVILIGAILFLKNEVIDDRLLDNLKALSYILIIPAIFSFQIMAFDRYNLESNWKDFLSIYDRNYFLSRWYNTDLKDRDIFLKRAYLVLSSDEIRDSETVSIVRALIYGDNNFINKDIEMLYPSVNKEISIYKSVLLYDISPSDRSRSITKLTDLILTLRNDKDKVQKSLTLLEKLLSEEKKIRRKDRMLYSSRKYLGLITSENSMREKAVTSILISTLQSDTDVDVRIDAIRSLWKLGNKQDSLIEIISMEKNKDILEKLEEAVKELQ